MTQGPSPPAHLIQHTKNKPFLAKYLSGAGPTCPHLHNHPFRRGLTPRGFKTPAALAVINAVEHRVFHWQTKTRFSARIMDKPRLQPSARGHGGTVPGHTCDQAGLQRVDFDRLPHPLK